MANIDEVFGSGTTLKAADLDGSEITLTIEKVEIKEFEDDGQTRRKPVLHFLGTEKSLVANVTNSRVIADVYGPETDDWVGKQVTLFPTRVTFGDKLVDAIRVRIIKQGGGKPKFMKNGPADEHPFAPGNDPEPPF